MSEGLEALKEFKNQQQGVNVYANEYLDIIEKEFKEKEKTDKVLEVIKDLFDFDFAIRFPDNQNMLRITNKRTSEYWEIPITQEQSDLLNY